MMRRSSAIPAIAASALASIAAHRWVGDGWGVTLGFTLANIIEAALAYKIASGDRLALEEGIGFGRLTIAALVSGVAGASVAIHFMSGDRAQSFLLWTTTDTIGVLLITPMIAIWGRILKEPHRELHRGRVKDIAATMSAMIVVTALSFAQTSYPLLFVPLVALMFSVMRLGALGAAMGMLAVALIGSAGLALGRGPTTFIRGSAEEQIIFLQFYFLALYACAIPLASLLGARERLRTELRRQNDLLNSAEVAAGIGHWRMDARSREIYWSPGIFRIYGLDGGRMPSIDHAVEAYVEADRPRVIALVEHALHTGEPYEFRAQLQTANGDLRSVFSRGEAERAPDGSIDAIFGILQDITASVQAEAALAEARHVAEQQAERALILAETDELTALPNRRKILRLLWDKIYEAHALSRPVVIGVIDVDHFKRINDTFGHLVGDEVLRRVADVCRASLRSGDSLGRLGGEEFLVILADTGLNAAEILVDRLRQAVEASGGCADTSPIVTISIGLADLRLDQGVEDLLGRADHALYEAKIAGRNRLRLAA